MLLIRKHATYSSDVGFVNFGGTAQLAFALAALLGKDMAQVRLRALETATGGSLETLRGTAIGFQFWHFLELRIR
jgi:hypothetical protein